MDNSIKRLIERAIELYCPQNNEELHAFVYAYARRCGYAKQKSEAIAAQAVLLQAVTSFQEKIMKQTHFCIIEIDIDPDEPDITHSILIYADGTGEPQWYHLFTSWQEARRYADNNLRNLQEITYPGAEGL